MNYCTTLSAAFDWIRALQVCIIIIIKIQHAYLRMGTPTVLSALHKHLQSRETLLPLGSANKWRRRWLLFVKYSVPLPVGTLKSYRSADVHLFRYDMPKEKFNTISVIHSPCIIMLPPCGSSLKMHTECAIYQCLSPEDRGSCRCKWPRMQYNMMKWKRLAYLGKIRDL